MFTIPHNFKMEPSEIFAKAGATVTAIFGTITLIDPQILTLCITAFAGIPTGIYYISKNRKTKIETSILKMQLKKLLDEENQSNRA